MLCFALQAHTVSESTLCCLQGWGNRIDDGDVDACFESEECDHIVEGVARMGGQDHFYLEPHGSITVPLENNEIKIYASTQVHFPNTGGSCSDFRLRLTNFCAPDSCPWSVIGMMLYIAGLPPPPRPPPPPPANPPWPQFDP